MDDGLNALWIKLFLFSKKNKNIYSLHTRASRQDHNSRDSVLLTHPCPFKTMVPSKPPLRC